jgi:hypothetical protein
MLPEYTIRPGIPSRTWASAAAGMVLSQPTRVTSPSSACLFATSSTESATTSRLIKEPFMPSVPIVMPSVIEIVLTSIGVPPAARIPCITLSASLRWFQLHGMVPIQLCATPMTGLARSSVDSPTARSAARAGARSRPARNGFDPIIRARSVAVVVGLVIEFHLFDPSDAPAAAIFHL